VSPAVGDRLGPYEITAKLGEGGMGEVWRATDTKLQRQVAIKVLPAAFTADEERLARFEREAKLLAQLHHPNIASIFGMEDSGETKALAMELVEGPTLAERLEQGSLSVEESLSIARQIAEALEEAHEKGIVHRDLKPQNIKASIEGKVKVLDFGLAKAMEPAGAAPGAPSGSQLAASPTMTLGGTMQGVIVGTAAYMAPEQAKGFPVDKKADIWAFGVVLFEMLTGRSLFVGDSVPDTLARVLQREVDFARLPASTPPAIRRLLRRCLERSPKKRLHDIADARIVIEEQLSGASDEGTRLDRPGTPTRSSRIARLAPWALTAACLAVVGWSLTRPGSGVAVTVEATILPPAGKSYYLSDRAPGSSVLSRDGSKLAFSAIDRESIVRLHVREMATGDVRELPGTEGAQYPFWSPDGRWIGFFLQGEGVLRKVRADGGAPLTVCRASNGKGGSWSEDGVIVFAPGPGGPIHRVSAEGGDSTAVTELDRERFNSHRHPRFLPDGKHFLFYGRAPVAAEGAVLVGSIEGGPVRELVASATQAEFASGHLLFVREGTLLAQDFDAGSLELSGSPSSIASDVAIAPGAAQGLFTVSGNGLLAIHRGAPLKEIRLELRDRQGALLGLVGSPAEAFRDLMFSPDGRRVAFTRSSGSEDDVYVLDLESGAESRMTFSPAEDIRPVWTTDGRSLIFASNRDGPHDLYRMPVDGAGRESLLLDTPGGAFTLAMAPNGREVVYTEEGSTGWELWTVDLESGEHRRVGPVTGSNAALGFSPDGRWVTVIDLAEGRREIFATPFPVPGRKMQLSTRGGDLMTWLPISNEIVYLEPGGDLWSVPAVSLGDSLELGAARRLFRVIAPTPEARNFGASPDGQRFLFAPDSAFGADNELELVVGWTSRLDRS